MRNAHLCAVAFFLMCGTGAAADLGAIRPTQDAFAGTEIVRTSAGWFGLYAGLSAGYGWLEDVDYAPAAGLPSPLYDKGEDWVLAGHVGYLGQWGNLVAGAEVEAMHLDIAYEGFDFITVKDALALKGRIGFAWDRWLLSGHAGAVYARTNFMGLKDWGWVLGAGVDYALTDNLSVGAQYSHLDFTEFDGTQIDATVDLVTARVSYRF